MVCCRYKLTSQGFLARLLHVRSIMKYDDVERVPAAVSLMRQMLWVESLVVRFHEGSAEAAAIFKLCRVGQSVLLEEEGKKRLVCLSSIPALHESLLSTQVRSQMLWACLQIPLGFPYNRCKHVRYAGFCLLARCIGHHSCTATTPAHAQHLPSGPLMS